MRRTIFKMQRNTDFGNNVTNRITLTFRQICRLLVSQFYIIREFSCFLFGKLNDFRFTIIMQTFNAIFLTFYEFFYKDRIQMRVFKSLVNTRLQFFLSATKFYTAASGIVTRFYNDRIHKISGFLSRFNQSSLCAGDPTRDKALFHLVFVR